MKNKQLYENEDLQQGSGNTSSPQKKPIFLYLVIILLTLTLGALGVLTFFSLNHLAALQGQVKELEKTVEDISNSSSTLTQQADQLAKLQEETANVTDAETADAQEAAQEENVEAAAQEEGTLSPSSSGDSDTFTDNADDSMDNLLSQINTLLPQDNGSWSVYVCNLAKNSDGAINNQPMQAASLIKLYIMGAVYENYDALSQQYGGDSLDQNLNAMITVSDNDAANTLVEWLGNGDNAAGMAKVNEFCQAHGYTNTSMGRMLLASNENGDNFTSVKDCGAFLKEIYQIDSGAIDGTLSHAQNMYYLLKMQTRKNKIPAQMPEGVQVANKTGELDTVENDAGIIYDTANGIDLVICFMSQDLNDTGAAQSAIAQNSRMIYGYYNE